MTRLLAAAVAFLAAIGPAQAAEVNVAVAANFTEAAKEIAKAFEAKTGHTAVLSFGATGQLYTQITQAAPFAVFLSADDETPKKAVREGFAVADTTFTYAVGKLVLWSKTQTVTAGPDALKNGAFTRLAIANPKTAPYGAAAVQALTALGVYADAEPKLVQGANITQAYQFVDTGNAEIGFVALSQVIGKAEGSQWLVPAVLYAPIRQDAVLLRRAAGNEAARALMDLLRSPSLHDLIRSYGYDR